MEISWPTWLLLDSPIITGRPPRGMPGRSYNRPFFGGPGPVPGGCGNEAMSYLLAAAHRDDRRAVADVRSALGAGVGAEQSHGRQRPRHPARSGAQFLQEPS